MKQIITRISLLGVAALLGGTISSCTPTSTGPNTTVNPPSNVSLSNRNSTSVAVRWDRNTSDTSPDTVMATPHSSTTATGDTEIAIGNSLTLTRLQPNVQYDISVKGGGGVSAPVTWWTATRLPSESNPGQTFTLFETADNSSSDPSGLNLAGNAAVATALGTPGRNTADLVLFTGGVDPTTSADTLYIQSGLASWIGGAASTFSNSVQHVVGGMDSIFANTSIANEFTGNVNSFYIPQGPAEDTHAGADFIFDVKTAAGNYARIDVIRQPNGTFTTTNGAGYKSIQVRVNYQTSAGQAYVSRPQSANAPQQARVMGAQ